MGPHGKQQAVTGTGVFTRQVSGPPAVFQRNFCGATWIFDEIGRKLGITDDLKACFPETWKQILSIAYYLILEDRNPLSRFPRWATNHRHPFGAVISSQRYSDLFSLITEEVKRQFFILQTKRRMETERCGYYTSVAGRHRLHGA
jgi:hypothetical protein